MQSSFSDNRTTIDLNTYQPSKKVGLYLAFVKNVSNYVTDADVYKNILHEEACLLNIQILLQRKVR
jgi:hypothetical protein